MDLELWADRVLSARRALQFSNLPTQKELVAMATEIKICPLCGQKIFYNNGEYHKNAATLDVEGRGIICTKCRRRRKFIY